MKKTISQRIALLIMLLAAAVGSMAARSNPGEKVNADFPDGISFDFGSISPDDAAPSHSFTLVNKGDKALAIIWAKPSCGCTVPKYPHKPLEPGQSATINVTFSPVGQKGHIDKTVRIRLKNADKKTEDVTLHITGNVVPDPK